MNKLYYLSPLGLLAIPLLAAPQQSAPSPSAAKVAASFQPFSPRVQTRADADTFYVESDGMPNHPMMVGIRAWQQQVPLPQRYTGSNAWQFPLKPVPAKNPLSAKDHFFRGAIAIAADGVPIFNALNNRGVDSNSIGELDEFGGHCGRADDYHYHVAPLYLEKTLKGKPIGYALDGYPLYGLTEPDGSAPGKLDAFNGHETSALGYHYHSTKTYPYLNGGFHGEVTEREGQVDPQPRASSPRPATPPLPGAKITGYEKNADGSALLTYVIEGQTCKIRYRAESDDSYTFDYINPEGKAVTLNYPQRGGREPGQGGGRGQGQGGGRGRSQDPAITRPGPSDFQLTSPAVTNGGSLPIEYTCDGQSVSLGVAWKNAPQGTKSFALVMHHIPPGGDESPHVYWLLYNLPASLRSVPRADKQLGERGSNTINRRAEYAPPCSQGPGKKWYTLTLYALSDTVTFEPGARVTRDALLAAMKDKTLSTAVMHVSYERQNQ